MRRSLGITVVGVALLLSLSHCTAIREFLGFGYTPPEVQLVSIDISKMSFSALTLKVGLEVKNPNDYDITLKKMDYRMHAMGLEMAYGSYNKTFTAPKHGIGRVKLPVDVEVQNALKLVKEFMGASESQTEIYMKADIVFDSPVGEIKKHFETVRKLKDL